MAASFQIDMSSKATALQSFARSFGQCPPRRPIPEWWNHFEAWYQVNYPLEATSRRSVLESFARPFGGEDLPKPIPEWGPHFLAWYDAKGQGGTQEDLDSTKFLRTEKFFYGEGASLEELKRKYLDSEGNPKQAL